MDRAVALKLLAAPYSQNEVFRLRLYSLESIAAQVVRQNPGLTPQLATVFVDTALSVYCPQGDY
jgi:Protein of unknown function (DUF732)